MFKEIKTMNIQRKTIDVQRKINVQRKNECSKKLKTMNIQRKTIDVQRKINVQRN